MEGVAVDLRSRRPWLRLRDDELQAPDGRAWLPCAVVVHPDWVDVIALTAALDIELVDQYRHSVSNVRTEFPASTVVPGAKRWTPERQKFRRV